MGQGQCSGFGIDGRARGGLGYVPSGQVIDKFNMKKKEPQTEVTVSSLKEKKIKDWHKKIFFQIQSRLGLCKQKGTTSSS